MGNSYDPTEYGMVELGGSGSSGAKPGADANSPEDILFESEAPSEPSPATAFPGPESPAGDFPETPETDAPHVDTPASDSAADDVDEGWAELEQQLAEREPEPASPPPKKGAKSRSKSLPKTKSGGPRARLTPRPPKIDHYRPPPRPSSWVVPLIVAALGLGTGSCLYLFMGNIPLGGLAGALGVVGAMFTRVLIHSR